MKTVLKTESSDFFNYLFLFLLLRTRRDFEKHLTIKIAIKHFLKFKKKPKRATTFRRPKMLASFGL